MAPFATIQEEPAGENAVCGAFLAVGIVVQGDKVKVDLVDRDLELPGKVLLGASEERLRVVAPTQISCSLRL